jgi:large subunit ribosomal protein L21
MFAVFQAGGHQYRVSQGDQITVDFLEGKKEGDKVSFSNILLVGGDTTKLGAPFVSGASIEAVVKTQTFNKKILVGKFKRRKDYKRTRGHKQPVTVLEISGIKS